LRQAALAHPFFTVGHSTWSIADFVALLQEGEVELVADVRTVPRSRRNPQYDRDLLPVTLASFELGYMQVPELGGLRKHSLIPPTVNSFWENESFHNSDYAMSSEFPGGPAEAPQGRARAALRHHVCRGRVVAVPSPDHRRLPHCCR